MKKIKAHLESKEDKSRLEVFEKQAQAFAKKVIGKFDDYDFYVGESMDPDGMVALLNYREDGVTPYMIFWKDGLKEVSSGKASSARFYMLMTDCCYLSGRTGEGVKDSLSLCLKCLPFLSSNWVSSFWPARRMIAQFVLLLYACSVSLRYLILDTICYICVYTAVAWSSAVRSLRRILPSLNQLSSESCVSRTQESREHQNPRHARPNSKGRSRLLALTGRIQIGRARIACTPTAQSLPS
jgi:hypothetical protein